MPPRGGSVDQAVDAFWRAAPGRLKVCIEAGEAAEPLDVTKSVLSSEVLSYGSMDATNAIARVRDARRAIAEQSGHNSRDGALQRGCRTRPNY